VGSTTIFCKCYKYLTALKGGVLDPTANKGAPMACCMVYWGNDFEKFQSIFLKFGAVVDITNLIGKRIAKKDEENILFQEYEFTVAQSFA
jgi:hypothetical protein